MRCRHQDSWLIGDAAYEWCFRCGAFRAMREVSPTCITPNTAWCYPVGPTGDNPWDLWVAQSKTYRKRKDSGMKCPKHPTYQAKRKPTSDCNTCKRIWLKAHKEKSR